MINEVNTSLSVTFSQLNLNIITAAFTQQNRFWDCCDAVAPFSRIYCVTGGEGKIIYNSTVYKLLPGMICIIPSKTKFEYHCDYELEKLYFHIQLHYGGETDLCSKIGKPLFFTGKEEKIAIIRKLYFDDSHSLKSSFMLKSEIYDILSEAFKESGVALGNAVFFSESVLRTQEYIDRHLKSNLTISEIAENLYISPSQLQKRFKSEVGKPIGKYIKDRIMTVAEQRLRTTSKTIRDISDELGFCDQFFFSRTFTEFYGISPRAYRNKIIDQKIF